MAMKKADLEAHHAAYDELIAAARRALREGLYREAIDLSVKSWDFIDGMMQYEKRYEKGTFDSVDGIDFVLRYAPLLFDLPILRKLEELLDEKRRIERNTSADMGEKVARARLLMWDAHRLWNQLELQGTVRQDELNDILGGDQSQWRSIVEGWEKMGLVRRGREGKSYRVTLSTRLGEVIPAKCPKCGAHTDAPKAKLLKTISCSSCKESVVFVLKKRA